MIRYIAIFSLLFVSISTYIVASKPLPQTNEILAKQSLQRPHRHNERPKKLPSPIKKEIKKTSPLKNKVQNIATKKQKDFLKSHGIDPKLYAKQFFNQAPKQIYFRKEGRLFTSAVNNDALAGSNLYISDLDSVKDIVAQREEQENVTINANMTTKSNSEPTPRTLRTTTENDSASSHISNHNTMRNQNREQGENSDDTIYPYIVYQFVPGTTRDNHLISRPIDINLSAQGPDQEYINTHDSSALARIREQTVSLGFGGSITLKLSHNNEIIDRPGADFVLYENPISIQTYDIETNSIINLVHNEYAKVGVSEDGRNYHWFYCDPQADQLLGCAGVALTSMGGDRFDLRELGVNHIRYIKIVDLETRRGTSLQTASPQQQDLNTEGFDLDGMQILHFSEQE